MNNYEARWNNACSWAKKLKEKYDTGLYLLEYDGEFLNFGETKIIINEDEQLIILKRNNCRYIIYDGDQEFDHGAFTPIKEFNKTVIDKIKLYKMESVIL